MDAQKLLHVIVGVTLPIAPGFAWAHGEYMWIQERDKRLGTACCGEHDCHKVKVELLPSAYRFAWDGHTYTVPLAEAKPSEDGQYWACITEPDYLRCFFAPPMGS